MKKLMSILTAGVLGAALLAGCGSTSQSSSAASSSIVEPIPAETTQSEESEETAGQTPAAAQPDAADTETETGSAGNVLVLYFSASGHTKNIADLIAQDTGADEFEITPSDPYTEEDLNYNDENSRVVKEHNDESLQTVAFDSYDIPDWDSYDTVFVGYPIWWQDASWVMKSYVQNVDFTGKTVIPFCTSSVSGIGDSGKNLESLAGTGTWLEGERFSGSASNEDVQSWIDSLNL